MTDIPLIIAIVFLIAAIIIFFLSAGRWASKIKSQYDGKLLIVEEPDDTSVFVMLENNPRYKEEVTLEVVYKKVG